MGLRLWFGLIGGCLGRRVVVLFKVHLWFIVCVWAYGGFGGFGWLLYLVVVIALLLTAYALCG